MTIDPRLRERRRVVAEDRARRNVRRLLKLLLLLSAIGAGVWFMLSPMMSVRGVAVAGVLSSDVHTVLANHDVVPGTPMILIRPGAVEQDIETDPWVAHASVRLEWPDRVVVRITERRPAAWVETQAGWIRRGLDGVAIPSPDEPDGTLGWVRLPGVGNDNAASSSLVLGAVEFIDALPDELGRDVVIRLEENELWALVSGFQVRLGRPVQMREKALSLEALLEADPPQGTVLTLIAPTNPAVTPPESLPGSGSETTDTSSQPAGDSSPVEQTEPAVEPVAPNNEGLVEP